MFKKKKRKEKRITNSFTGFPLFTCFNVKIDENEYKATDVNTNQIYEKDLYNIKLIFDWFLYILCRSNRQ